MVKVAWDKELIRYLVESTWNDVAGRGRGGKSRAWEENWETKGSNLVKDKSVGGCFQPD